MHQELDKLPYTSQGSSPWCLKMHCFICLLINSPNEYLGAPLDGNAVPFQRIAPALFPQKITKLDCPWWPQNLFRSPLSKESSPDLRPRPPAFSQLLTKLLALLTHFGCTAPGEPDCSVWLIILFAGCPCVVWEWFDIYLQIMEENVEQC